MSNSITGIIPARAGSLRIPNKNSLKINGLPIISYSISSAKLSGCFNKVVVASDDEDICNIGAEYGADIVVKRNSQDAMVTSLDIDWLQNLQRSGYIDTEYFAILRPTSPQRSAELIRQCTEVFFESSFDSLRTIKKVSEHPGKMWRFKDSSQILPYLPQASGEPATHAKQYQSLEPLYVQTSVYEIAKTQNITLTSSREGNSVLGYLTSGIDTFALDTLEDVDYLNYLVKFFPNLLPEVFPPLKSEEPE
jgi:CMP-N-acetylneuraminic acid synthetase